MAWPLVSPTNESLGAQPNVSPGPDMTGGAIKMYSLTFDNMNLYRKEFVWLKRTIVFHVYNLKLPLSILADLKYLFLSGCR